MNITEYSKQEISYTSVSQSSLALDETTSVVKLRLQTNRKSLIFLSEKPNLRGGGGNQQEYNLAHTVVHSEIPSNYILAKKNLDHYRDTALNITRILKSSLVSKDIKHNTTIGEDLLEKLKDCTRLDEDPRDTRKFLIVTREIVLQCIDRQNLSPDRRAMYTSILLYFYNKANSLYSEEYPSVTPGAVASVGIRSLVNSERILLTLYETGIHINQHEKVFLSNILKVLDSQFQIIQDYKANLEDAERTWYELFSNYKRLLEISENAIATLKDNLMSAQEKIRILDLSLDREKRKYFFVRYWKYILFTLPVLIFVIVSYIWLVKFYFRAKHPPSAVQINLIQPAKEEPKKDVNEILLEPSTHTPSVPSPVNQTFKFRMLDVVVAIQALALVILFKNKLDTLRDSKSHNLNKIREQEIEEALHKRGLKVLEPSKLEIDSINKFTVDGSMQKVFLNIVQNLGNNLFEKSLLLISFLSLIGKRK